MKIILKEQHELKPVLGAYSAMARNNAYLTVLDIMDQLHIRQKKLFDKNGDILDPESHIKMLDLFPKNHCLLPEQEAKAIKLLRFHFPFLDLSDDLIDTDEGQGRVQKNYSFKDLCNAFLSMIEVLTHLRDLNLHYKTNDNKVTDFNFRLDEKKAGLILRDVLKAAPRKIKDRYRGTGILDEDSLKFFQDGSYVRQERKYIFNLKWQFSPQRLPLSTESPVMKNGQPVIDESTGKTVQFHRLSTFGEVLLISLFTEKRHIPDFLRDCGLDKVFESSGQNDKMSQYRIIREILSAYSIRLPERKLNIEAEETQIKLDMLNELSRCPSALYDVLPDNEKRKFVIEGNDGSPVLMKRHSDRYVPLMLKYFDINKVFYNLRFQVNAGLLRYEFHGKKEYMDGVERIRIVQEGVNGFGRIQEIEEKRTEDNSFLGFPLLKTDEEGIIPSLPYITDSASRYILNGNLIGISINGDIFPHIDTIKTGTDTRYKVHCQQPDCWLSRFELPALAFYVYLSRKYRVKRTAEDIIVDKVREYRDFFSGVADGHIKSLEGVSIPKKDIPEKLLQYLEGANNPSRFSHFKDSMISKLINDTEERLSRLEDNIKIMNSKENRIGKRSFVRIRPGKLASFLAEDIVRFQGYAEGHPEKRLTGQQYSILQGMIATFADELPTACKKACLLDGETAHPFLGRLFSLYGKNLSSTVDFYRAYLEERLRYLKGEVPDNAPFLHPDRKKWVVDKNDEYYRALATRYVKDEKTGDNVGIFLPRGLFDQPVREILNMHCPNTAKIIKEADRANMAFIILTYLENQLDDQNQEFYYKYDRLKEYGFCRIVQKEKLESGNKRLFAILRKEQNANPDGSYFNSLKEEVGKMPNAPKKTISLDSNTQVLADELKRLYKQMCENEKVIRQHMVQDVTLFLLARNIIPVAGNSVCLCSVGPTGDGILDQRVDVTTPYKAEKYNPKKKSTNVKKYLIKQNGIKIKDYGEIYKVLKDKRIDSLLLSQDNESSPTIQLEDIKEELVTYNRKRVPVIKTIQGYEKEVYEENEEVFANNNERFGFQEILNADQKSSPLKKEVIRQVRNAFSHNQYPGKTVYKGEEHIDIFKPELPNIAAEIHENTVKIINEKGES